MVKQMSLGRGLLILLLVLLVYFSVFGYVEAFKSFVEREIMPMFQLNTEGTFLLVSTMILIVVVIVAKVTGVDKDIESFSHKKK